MKDISHKIKKQYGFVTNCFTLYIRTQYAMKTSSVDKKTQLEKFILTLYFYITFLLKGSNVLFCSKQQILKTKNFNKNADEDTQT